MGVSCISRSKLQRLCDKALELDRLVNTCFTSITATGMDIAQLNALLRIKKGLFGLKVALDSAQGENLHRALERDFQEVIEKYSVSSIDSHNAITPESIAAASSAGSGSMQHDFTTLKPIFQQIIGEITFNVVASLEVLQRGGSQVDGKPHWVAQNASSTPLFLHQFYTVLCQRMAHTLKNPEKNIKEKLAVRRNYLLAADVAFNDVAQQYLENTLTSDALISPDQQLGLITKLNAAGFSECYLEARWIDLINHYQEQILLMRPQSYETWAIFLIDMVFGYVCLEEKTKQSFDGLLEWLDKGILGGRHIDLHSNGGSLFLTTWHSVTCLQLLRLSGYRFHQTKKGSDDRQEIRYAVQTKEFTPDPQIYGCKLATPYQIAEFKREVPQVLARNSWYPPQGQLAWLDEKTLALAAHYIHELETYVPIENSFIPPNWAAESKTNPEHSGKLQEDQRSQIRQEEFDKKLAEEAARRAELDEKLIVERALRETESAQQKAENTHLKGEIAQQKGEIEQLKEKAIEEKALREAESAQREAENAQREAETAQLKEKIAQREGESVQFTEKLIQEKTLREAENTQLKEQLAQQEAKFAQREAESTQLKEQLAQQKTQIAEIYALFLAQQKGSPPEIKKPLENPALNNPAVLAPITPGTASPPTAPPPSMSFLSSMTPAISESPGDANNAVAPNPSQEGT